MTKGPTPSWSDAAVPAAEDCVLPLILTRRAQEHGERVFALLDDGRTVTYAQMLRDATRTANALRILGVEQGDPVLSWLPNSYDALRMLFGVNLLGAIYTPVNTAYRGGLLEHVIANSGARVAIVHEDLAGRLDHVARGALEHVVIAGDALDGPADPITTPRPIEPWDPHSIIYTSGTTGPSKGVVSSYVHVSTSAAVAFEGRFGPEDRYMVNLPLFHAGGTLGVTGALAQGGSVALVSGFDTNSFWKVIREWATTCVTLLGVMAGFLVKEPPREDDTQHPLRTVFMVPLIADAPAFAERFGLTVVTMFNMTEISIPIVSDDNPATNGTCGRLRAGVDARLVDAPDREVPDGDVGELILRTDRPWAMNSGYWANPEATAAAWRNGWFHTGDGFRLVDGEYFFVDRIKDAIRRRGENISSFEVEAELLAHPLVREAAAVAVPGDVSEEEVLAIVAPVPGATIDPVALIEFLRPRVAHFMVPRYVRVMEELPKTPTSKVRKHILREQGLTPETWDREAAGITVKRERIGNTRA